MHKDMHIQGPQIHQFSNIDTRKKPRSNFKRDFPHRTTINVDNVYPIFVDEIYPGDDISVSMTAQLRVPSAVIKPIMDNMYFETMWFFTPFRILWDNWEKFQGAQLNPGDSVDYLIPVLDHTLEPLSTTGFLTGTLADYMGLPTLVSSSGETGDLMAEISALYFRNYYKIYDEWFRDENFQNSSGVSSGDGPDNPGLYQLFRRGKRKDYLTSCLAAPQKGEPITIPLGTSAPVVTTGTPPTFTTGAGFTGNLGSQSGNDNVFFAGSTPTGAGLLAFAGTTGLSTDLSSASAETINALRQAALYQQILELDNRGGTRYVESLFSRWGVISPDFRLQRPELIGQGSQRINVFAVPQTASTSSGDTPQGNLAAFSATPITGGHGCRYSATEHGILMGLCSIRADLTYQQKLPKRYSRRTRLDFYEPLLNGLGEQAVLNAEVAALGTSDDSGVFGYQERFSELRYMDPMITGYLRSNAPTTLDVWGLWQEFDVSGGPIPLNQDFIINNTPIDRILAVATSLTPNFIADMQFYYNHTRVMPIRSNPGINIL